MQTKMPKFKKSRSVTRGLLKLEAGKSVMIQIQDALYKGEKVDPRKDPATLANVVDLTTGEDMIFIAATVLEKELRKAYPNDSYVGKYFEIKRQKGADDAKKYNVDTITELEIDETPDEPQAAASTVIETATDTAGADTSTDTGAGTSTDTGADTSTDTGAGTSTDTAGAGTSTDTGADTSTDTGKATGKKK